MRREDDTCDCIYERCYDVDSSDYSGYDGYDQLDLNSSPDVWVDIDPSYVPHDIDCLHELHEPNFCGVFCELYGRFAPTDGELSHAIDDLANYDPGPRKIPPESGSVMVHLSRIQNTEYRIYFQFPIYIYDTIQHNDRIYNR